MGPSQALILQTMPLFNLEEGNQVERRKKVDVWRVNLSLLQDKEVGEKVSGLWRQQEQHPAKSGIGKLLKAMDDTKSFLRQYGAQKAKERRHQEDELRMRLSRCQQLRETGTPLDQEEQNELAEVKRQLGLLEQRKAKGWAVRAKLKWAAEGDIPEKFYFNRLK